MRQTTTLLPPFAFIFIFQHRRYVRIWEKKTFYRASFISCTLFRSLCGVFCSRRALFFSVADGHSFSPEGRAPVSGSWFLPFSGRNCDSLTPTAGTECSRCFYYGKSVTRCSDHARGSVSSSRRRPREQSDAYGNSGETRRRPLGDGARVEGGRTGECALERLPARGTAPEKGEEEDAPGREHTLGSCLFFPYLDVSSS